MRASTHAHTHEEIGEILETSNPNDDWFVHWNTLGRWCLYRTFWRTSLVVPNDSLRGCVRPSVSPSVCPSIRPSVGNTNFWLAKKGQKWDQRWQGGQRLDESRLISCIRSYFHGKQLILCIQTCFFKPTKLHSCTTTWITFDCFTILNLLYFLNIDIDIPL